MSRKEALDLFDDLSRQSNDVFLQISEVAHGPNYGRTTDDLIRLKEELYNLINVRMAEVLKELFPDLP